MSGTAAFLNAPSGGSYHFCTLFVPTDRGIIMVRRVKTIPDVEKILRQQRKRFAKKFGREPAPSDPIFFDSQASAPTSITEERNSQSNACSWYDSAICVCVPKDGSSGK